MPETNSIIELIQKAGVRLTPQRRLVITVISQQKGHVTAETILKTLKKHYPYFDISTLYRNLELMSTLGIINEAINQKGIIEYELVTDQHHDHLVCTVCHNTIEAGHDLFADIEVLIQKKYNFIPKLKHVSIPGICKNCQS